MDASRLRLLFHNLNQRYGYSFNLASLEKCGQALQTPSRAFTKAVPASEGPEDAATREHSNDISSLTNISKVTVPARSAFQAPTTPTITVFLVDERFEVPRKTAHDISISIASRQGCPEGQFLISTKDLVRALVKSGAISGKCTLFCGIYYLRLTGLIKLSTPHPRDPEFMQEFVICKFGEELEDVPPAVDLLLVTEFTLRVFLSEVCPVALYKRHVLIH